MQICGGRGQFSGVLSFHLMEPEDQTHVVNLDGQCLYLQSHPTNPNVFFFSFLLFPPFWSCMLVRKFQRSTFAKLNVTHWTPLCVLAFELKFHRGDVLDNRGCGRVLVLVLVLLLSFYVVTTQKKDMCEV